MHLQQLMSIHSRKLHLMKHGESMYLEEIKTINEAFSIFKPPPHTLSILITCIHKTSFEPWCEWTPWPHQPQWNSYYFNSTAQSKHSKVLAKCKVALNRLAALVNLPPSTDLTAAVIHDILRNKNNEPNIFLPTTKSTMHTSADYKIPTSLAHSILPSPPTCVHLTHQQASVKHPQHKRSPAPNLPPQPIIHTHSLDAAYLIHQPN